MDACCKVGRAVEKYQLHRAIGEQSIDEYLVARWSGRGDYSATGLRPLKDWFNHRLLKQVYTEHGRNALDTRVESDYEALTDDTTALPLLDDLAADGIDGEALRSDFVSTATLYRHFTECLDESKSDDTAEPSTSDWEVDKIAYAKDIVRTNVEESLRSLENKRRLPRGSDAEIKTDIVLGCPDCSTQVGLERALERGYVCDEHMGPEPESSTVEENA
ncbi:rod-determining factor RdfA [Haloarcula onubensis]|uniref:Uncharacterized protein n=1 Tax=Haloarcula onubensis TaxID=2950539 RepID=A0ABU2FJ29_9EURY|nr:rod-determining factor RdfA [Halomicroarcula sp. S3CR25-11]MDS0280743.1 hypothetical protein [Halomicroarcula sp. S3CR25-11]